MALHDLDLGGAGRPHPRPGLRRASLVERSDGTGSGGRGPGPGTGRTGAPSPRPCAGLVSSDAVLRVLVYRPGSLAPDHGDGTDDLRRRAHRQLLAECGGDACDVEVTVGAGHPASQLLEVAASTDLLVLGRRRHGGEHATYLGPVARAVLPGRSAPCCWAAEPTETHTHQEPTMHVAELMTTPPVTTRGDAASPRCWPSWCATASPRCRSSTTPAGWRVCSARPTSSGAGSRTATGRRDGPVRARAPT